MLHLRYLTGFLMCFWMLKSIFFNLVLIFKICAPWCKRRYTVTTNQTFSSLSSLDWLQTCKKFGKYIKYLQCFFLYEPFTIYLSNSGHYAGKQKNVQKFSALPENNLIWFSIFSYAVAFKHNWKSYKLNPGKFT